MLETGVLDTCFFVSYFVLVAVLAFVVGRKKKAPLPEQVEGPVWKPSITRLSQVELAVGYPWYKNLWLWTAIWASLFASIFYYSGKKQRVT